MLAIIFPAVIFFCSKFALLTINDHSIESMKYNMEISYYQNSVRTLTVDLIRGCGSNEDCIFWEIYSFLEDFDYIPSEFGVVYPPLETIKMRGGDCKNLVVTACAMMRSVGQDCRWSISEVNDAGMRHIIGLTQLRGGLMAFDLTVPTTMIVETPDDYWNEWWT